MTPGAFNASVSIPPPAAFDGKSVTFRLSKFDEISDVVWAISSAPAIIVTVSAAVPISKLTGTSVSSPSRTATSDTVAVLNPEVVVTVIE